MRMTTQAAWVQPPELPAPAEDAAMTPPAASQEAAWIPAASTPRWPPERRRFTGAGFAACTSAAQQPALMCEGHKLDPGTQLELVQHVPQMGLYGGLGDKKVLCNLLVA